MSAADDMRAEAERLHMRALISDMLALGSRGSNGDPLATAPEPEVFDEEESNAEVEAYLAAMQNGGPAEDEAPSEDELVTDEPPRVPRRVRFRLHQPPAEEA